MTRLVTHEVRSRIIGTGRGVIPDSVMKFRRTRCHEFKPKYIERFIKKFSEYGVSKVFVDRTAEVLLGEIGTAWEKLELTNPFKGLDELLTAKIGEFGGRNVKITRIKHPGAGKNGSDDFSLIIVAIPENVRTLNALLRKVIP